MDKTIYGYRIGANIKEPEAPSEVKLVPDNKTLVAMAFNDNHDEDVKPIRLKSTKEIFANYKPNKEVVLKTPDGESEDLTLEFKNLKDFTKEGIIAQSDLLQQLKREVDTYTRMIDVFQHNNKIQNVIANEEQKKEFIELLETLIQELEVA